MNIYLGADHAGFELKEQIKQYFNSKKTDYQDLGNLKFDPNDDYPDFAFKVAEAVAQDKNARGILICGSSFGVCIAANKMKGIRAVSIDNVIDAKLSREHNDANVLCLSGGAMKQKAEGVGLDISRTKEIIQVWLNSSFSDEQRHKRRINKIMQYEKA